MIELPLIQELGAERMQEVAAAVQAIQEEPRLKELHKLAVGCGDLSLFRTRLQS